MSDRIVQLYHHMLLVESLDKPYQLTDITSTIDQDVYDQLEPQGFSELVFHKCDDEDGHFFFTGKRNNAYEVHHLNYKDGIQKVGINQSGLDKNPSKFVTTAMMLATDKLKAGHQVRIVAEPNMIDSYHRLAKVIGKRFGYSVSDHIPSSDGYRHEFMITPPKPLLTTESLRKSLS